MRTKAVHERVSDPPEPTSTGRALSLGCGGAVVAILLFAGLAGLAYRAWSRFGAPALGVQGADGDEVAGLDDLPPLDPADPSTPGSHRSGDPLADMRRRYVLGPHVRLEGMSPGPASMAAGRGGVHGCRTGRSADTPWNVLGATYEPGPPPSTTPAPTALARLDPRERTDQPLDVLAGAPVDLRVGAADASGGPGVTSYAIAFDGYRGHFTLPATVPTELGLVSAGGSDGALVRFLIGAAARPDGSLATAGQGFRSVIRVAAIDAQGHVSSYVARELEVLPVGSGDLEVSVTMSEPTYLDLYVTDPTCNTVYFGNTHGGTGGQLDLDANAACGGHMGVDTEHIFWPAGRAPRGTYSVRVAHYESCIQGRAFSYRLTIQNCGETVVITGGFAGGARSSACLTGGQDPSWCQDVVSFRVPTCAQPNTP